MAMMRTKMMTVSLKNGDNTATRCGNGAQPHRELNRATGKGTCLGGPVLYIYIVYVLCILYVYIVYNIYSLSRYVPRKTSTARKNSTARRSRSDSVTRR